MDKRKINEEQFRKIVISEAKKFLSEESSTPEKKSEPEYKRRVTFDKVESLIKEIEQMPKSIMSISFDDNVNSDSLNISEEAVNKPNRDLDVIEHNKKKNVLHVNEGEKDKWTRMLNYKIPTDDQR